MSSLRSVQFALTGFYDALQEDNSGLLQQVWARTLPVSCAHPGWPPMTCREDILDIWDAILANPDYRGITCLYHKIQMVGDLGIVLCRETVGNHVMAATNIFAQEENRWVLVHHQASPVVLGDDTDGAPLVLSDDWEDDWTPGTGGLDHAQRGSLN